MTIFKNPENRQNYLLLIGAADLKNLSFASNSDPCRTWVDGCVYEAGRTDAIREIKLDKLKPILE
jgi:hypothetical protein